ncbi:MAG: c-type cytochrome domain-containing protein [Verrucomicrobiota bacterium]
MKELFQRTAVFACFIAANSIHAEEADKITFADHVLPILENKCVNCHNPDESKGGLDLSTYSGTLSGGSGGEIAVPEDPGSSRLFTLSAHIEEPVMPPRGTKASEQELKILTDWINGGLLETASSTARKSDKPKVDLDSITSTGKPEGPPAMPEHLILEPEVITERPNSVPAMAHSPWAPILAVAGQKQVLLYHSEDYDLLGVLPYPEGFPQTLSFSPNGAYLSCGGGRAGKSGNVVAWDIKTGERIIEVGKEYDIVLGADVSPDLRNAVMGGPGRNIKIWDTVAGEQIASIKKHPDWLLTAAYSPDGVIFATGGRNGGLYVWEAATGYEFYTLKGHTAAVTDMAWRSDGNVLGSCSEDGQVILWEMNEGKQVKKWNAHGDGVQSIAFSPDGKIATVGRDKTVKIWQGDGKEIRSVKASDDIILSVAFSHDSKRVFTGDWFGNVKVWSVENGAELASIAPNPPTIEQQLAYSERKIREITGELPKLQKGVKEVSQELTQARNQLAAVDQSVAEANKIKGTEQAKVAKLEDQIKALDPEIATLRKKLTEVQSGIQERSNSLTSLLAEQKKQKSAHDSAAKELREREASLADLKVKIAALNAEKIPPAPDAPKMTKHQSLGVAKAKAEEEKKALDSKVAAKQKELANLNAQIQDPQNAESIDALRKRSEAVSEEIKSFRAHQQTKAQVIAKLETEWKPIREAISRYQQQVNQAKEQRNSLQKELLSGEQSLKQSQTNLAAIDQALGAFPNRIKQIETMLGGAKAEEKKVQASLNSKQSSRADLAKQVASARESLKKAEATLANAAKRKGEAKAKVDSIVKKESDTRKSIELAKVELETNEFLVKKWEAAAINLTALEESEELEEMTFELEVIEEDVTEAKSEVAEATEAREEAEKTLAKAKQTVVVGNQQLQEKSSTVLEKALELVASRAMADLREEVADETGPVTAKVEFNAIDEAPPTADLPPEGLIEEDVEEMAAETLAYKTREELDAEVSQLKSRLSELETLLQKSYSEADKTKATVVSATKVARETPKLIEQRTQSEEEAARELAEAEEEQLRQEKALADQKKLIEELKAKYFATLPERN